jgi:DNA-binding protein YbaB
VDWKQQAAENTRRYQELTDQVSQLSITDVSPDGSVRVTVSASGLVTDVELREHGYRRPMAQMADEIMMCMRRAQARIPDLLGQVVTDALGAADSTTHLLVADARQMFPQPPPRQGWASAPETKPVEQPRQPVRPDDDGWQEPSVFEDAI